MIEQQIIKIIESIKQKNIMLFCGAGISKKSDLPLANELKQAILENLLSNKTYIQKIMEAELPFEIFLEIISEQNDISEIIDIFRLGEPDSIHIFIAKLAKNGYIKTIVTTNFDLLIERALEKEDLIVDNDFVVYCEEKHFSNNNIENKEDRIRLFKIHGSANIIQSIRTTLTFIAYKFLSDLRYNLMRHIFSTGLHKYVLFLGYSCSDVFDITNHIESFSNSNKKILLIDHSNSEEFIEDISIKNYKNPFKKYTGKRLFYDTDKLIDELNNGFKYDLNQNSSIDGNRTKWRTYVDNWGKKIRESVKYDIVGLIFQHISYIEEAIELHKESLSISYKISNLKGVAKTCGYIGNAYHSLGNLNKAIEYTKQSIVINNNINEKVGEAIGYGNLGTIFDRMGDFMEAIECHMKSIEIGKEINDFLILINSCTNLASAYKNTGNFKKAIEIYKKATELNINYGNKSGEVACYSNLGSSYRNLQDYSKAIYYHKKALKISKQIRNKYMEAQCYTNLGNVYRGKENYNKAIAYHKKGLEINRDIGNKDGELKCYLNLGNVYCSQEDFDTAIKYHNKSLKIAIEIRNKVAETHCYINIGSVNLGQKFYEKAIKYYLIAENMCKNIGLSHAFQELYSSLSYAYEMVGDFVNSEKYRKLSETQ